MTEQEIYELASDACGIAYGCGCCNGTRAEATQEIFLTIKEELEKRGLLKE